MSTWRPFPGLFPVDTRGLLSILLPKLLVDADQLALPGQPRHYAQGSRPRMLEIQTAPLRPGVYHLRVLIHGPGGDWSPWMDPAALQMWLILEYPSMFMVAV